MPFREVCVEELREQMVLEALAGRRTKAEIATQFSVTRKTVYKWMERYQAHGREGLRSSRGSRTTWRARSLSQWRPSCCACAWRNHWRDRLSCRPT